MSNNVKMGFEGQIYTGTAGSTGGMLLTNTGDINYNLDAEKGDTTVRGDGSSVPIKTDSITALGVQIEWDMIHDVTDSALSTLLTAAFAGTAVAIRTKDYAAGKGFDGDCSLTVQDGLPLKGQTTKKFTATPTREAGRMPNLYV
jgi:hypothetical protein